MRLFVFTGLLVGCAYQAGSFDSELQPFPGQRASMDCLDVSIQRRPDLPRGDVVLAYAFGNSCDHPTLVDLSTAIVVGRDAKGTVRLAAYDPYEELRPLFLDGRAVGHEALSYQRTSPSSDICVDAASITHSSSTRWMCFAETKEITEVP